MARLSKTSFRLAMRIAETIERGELKGGKRVKKVRQSLFDFLKGRESSEQERIMEDIIAGRTDIGEINNQKRVS